jgi:hypothetical protein
MINGPLRTLDQWEQEVVNRTAVEITKDLPALNGIECPQKLDLITSTHCRAQLWDVKKVDWLGKAEMLCLVCGWKGLRTIALDKFKNVH